MNETAGAGFELQALVGVLRRRWPIVAAAVVASVAIAVGLSSLQDPLYVAKTRVLLQAPGAETTTFGGAQGAQIDPELVVRTEIEVLKSTPVQRAVEEELGGVRKVGGARVGETLVIEVHGSSGDARRAKRVADAYAKAYVDFRRQQPVQELLTAGREVQSQVARIEREIAELEARVQAAPPDEREAVEESVRSRREALVGQQSLFEQRLDELQVQSALKSSSAQIVTPARIPESPVRPAPARNGAIAGVLGLMLGAAIALVVDRLDDVIRSRADLVEVVGELPVLGVIPKATELEDSRDVHFSLKESGTPAAEAYRSLRTSILLLGIDRRLSRIQFTSAEAGEGKTTTITNLAVVMGFNGRSVAVVDADLRRGRVHEVFGRERSPGFTSVLAGDLSLDAATRPVAGAPGVRLLTTGPIPANPSELVSSEAARSITTSLSDTVDTVLVDSPPVLAVTDAAMIARWVDATVVVVAAGRTRRGRLHDTLAMLRQTGAPVAGVVLNMAEGDGANYGYGYEYRAVAADDTHGRVVVAPVARAH